MAGRTLALVVAGVVALTPMMTAAAETTAVLSAAMSCPMSDPPVLRRLLQRLPGVTSVEVSYDDKTVTVVYDDALSSPEDFLAAYEDFGIEAGLADAMPADGDAPAGR